MKGNPARTATILGILGLVIVAALGWFFVISPRLTQADDISAQAEQAELTNLQLQSRLNQTKSLVAEAPQGVAEAQTLFATMPEAAELPTVLRQITDAAAKAGLGPDAVQVITTTVPTPVGRGQQQQDASKAGVSLASMDIGVTVQGSRAQFLTFLDNLQGLDRALLVTATQVTGGSPQDPNAPETLQANGSMFVLQSKLPDLVAQLDTLVQEADAAGSTTQPAG